MNPELFSPLLEPIFLSPATAVQDHIFIPLTSVSCVYNHDYQMLRVESASTSPRTSAPSSTLNSGLTCSGNDEKEK